MSAVGSRYRATASEEMSVDASVCVCVIINCKTWSRAVSKSPINLIINPNPVYILSSDRVTIDRIWINDQIYVFIYIGDSGRPVP
jgi:hypothetical protein